MCVCAVRQSLCIFMCLVPVASRGDEVETTVHPGVWDDLLAHHAVLLIQVEIKLIINVIQYGRPANNKHYTTIIEGR